MDTDNENTLVEISDKVDSLEKPKRKATPRQLESLAKARQVRAESKQKELQEEEKHRKLLPTYTKESDVEPMLPKEKKAYRKAPATSSYTSASYTTSTAKKTIY